ncbi:VOC family protein [Polycyclovorans algicola]|uniref:VOC family protein n=1 Tax=Polycyclovorans algicola TaxID=616992 RepID=UPI0004A6D568|nr:VOC family protein [Polycyclovorans algicola]
MTAPQSLAYIVAESSDLSKWQHYGEQMLGMQTHISADGLHLKMDARDHRIAVITGDQDRYVASGWEMGSDADFDAAVNALNAAGVATTEADGSARGFTRMVRFSDPAGNAHELVTGYVGKTTPFQSPIGVAGFKTGIYGMGHTVLPAPADFDATLKLFKDVLGMGLSDVFNFQPGPDAPVMRIYFLHGASGRHHSLALAEMPHPAGCVHVMVEVDHITDVGKAHDRREKLDIKMMATLGEHENDRMTSFYMLTPSNFALEYGWGGIEVDPATWQTTHTKQVSIWGHDFSVGFQ